ncbi:hypothetical protein LTR99_002705 [Exophiala xenobiotica]|uniref:Stress-response A/B barrel domain-containing protein n=1 Tax=Vermiconidia calcicola TaxID=1690605 RepID=A0AAV9QH52_9PEZI|nr:hypothetical protein LTR92_005186 [Exophiala xenobiotica]KAK5541960.1 hypothetical protein LTR25_001845 [Vermiconidia calcicola]KAK5543075.1 hypothetical protein LTR23_005116 [Chaetothyriales sp. CCFEE 6169]KAK5273314.1 hypothetical protein LTR96_002946 [Exophiala xenobiotica]KAK5307013.1 hypothetical protein LTR99_002705 [Exophiala xenobiotica]
MPAIERVTLFKIPKESDRQLHIEQYGILAQSAQKDGKAYIHNLTVGQPHQDQRAKGWNLAVKSTYESLADMEYYDKQCPAHAELKKITSPTREESMVVFYENAL